MILLGVYHICYQLWKAHLPKAMNLIIWSYFSPASLYSIHTKQLSESANPHFLSSHVCMIGMIPTWGSPNSLDEKEPSWREGSRWSWSWWILEITVIEKAQLCYPYRAEVLAVLWLWNKCTHGLEKCFIHNGLQGIKIFSQCISFAP